MIDSRGPFFALHPPTKNVGTDKGPNQIGLHINNKQNPAWSRSRQVSWGAQTIDQMIPNATVRDEYTKLPSTQDQIVVTSPSEINNDFFSFFVAIKMSTVPNYFSLTRLTTVQPRNCDEMITRTTTL
jgi:hypothetical protein